MGKRKGGGLSGLSRFVLESFKNEPESQPIQPEHVAQDSQHPDDSTVSVFQEHPESRSSKRRKTKGSNAVPEPQTQTEETGQWIEKYDATGLVPHYTKASQVPDHLKKYFSQRARYFSLYSTPPGCLLDEEGWYSVTPELIANQIAERCRCDTVVDAFCGVGGNAIAFAQTCQRVIALDTSPTRLALARHNAQIYGVADRIEFVLSDYISFANAYLSLSSDSPQASKRKIDVVFLSPPWGGPSYLSGTPNSAMSSPQKNSPEKLSSVESHPSYSLSSIQPIHGAALFRLSRRITQNIAYYLPRNAILEEISDLLESESEHHSAPRENTDSRPAAEVNGSSAKEPEMVEVEEEWMGTKLKALTCYFGGLAAGQDHLFDPS